MRIYTIDSKKMIKPHEEGWKPHQEQARTYHKLIEQNEMNYNVESGNKKEIEKLFSFTSVTDELKELDPNDFGLIISVKFIEGNKYCMTFYFHPKNKSVTHYTIANYSQDDSDYLKAKQIVDYINAKTYERG